MEIKVFEDLRALGRAAAKFAEGVINRAIAEQGYARIVLSTGESQFETIKNLTLADVDWSKVEMFHLDEYIGLPKSHPASFRKYLEERFINKINLKAAYLVDGEGDYEAKNELLSQKLLEKPVDLGVIGIGQNAHLAFNDPPADFETEKPYIVVKLSDTCKDQQVSEGWFPTREDVPEYAISMSINRILKCRTILSCVPSKVKAEAIRNTLKNDITNLVPATMLKTHPYVNLYLDLDSASLLGDEFIEEHLAEQLTAK